MTQIVKANSPDHVTFIGILALFMAPKRETQKSNLIPKL